VEWLTVPGLRRRAAPGQIARGLAPGRRAGDGANGEVAVTERQRDFEWGWAQAGGTPRSTLGGPLALADFGSFFVGGRTTRSEHPGSPATGLLAPGDVTVDQMYVQYMIPARIEGPPVVLVHGFNHTGAHRAAPSHLSGRAHRSLR
jgi:hypothetical protein